MNEARMASEDRRRRMLNIAGELFLEHGYEKVSTADLVRRLGGSKATLYAYFPSKADLFLAVVADQVATLSGAGAPILEQGEDLRTTLLQLGRASLSLSLTPKILALYRIGASEVYRHPGLAAEVARLRRSFTEPVVSFFATAAEEGLLEMRDPELASDHFAQLCRARHFENVLFGISPPPSEEEISSAVDEAVDVFLRAYAPQQG